MKPHFHDLTDVLAPVRDIYVASLLETIATELGNGADIDPEPVDRDDAGRIRRQGALDLPSRHDLRIGRCDRAETRSVVDGLNLGFDMISLRIGEKTGLRLAPFAWNRACIQAAGSKGAPNWQPLRRWFLEWFQARFGEESPELLGVVHHLDGPVDNAKGWNLTVDLGSASPACFIALLDALAECGCTEIAVGETADAC